MLRIWLREVLLTWHDFVASLLPPVQLLSWLRREHLTWEELEERMKQQAFRPVRDQKRGRGEIIFGIDVKSLLNFRFCLLTAFDFWVAWVANERQEGPPGSVQPGIKAANEASQPEHPSLPSDSGPLLSETHQFTTRTLTPNGQNAFKITGLKAICRDPASFGFRMWVIDTSRWPKPWQQSDRPYVPADRSERRGYWAKRRAMKLCLDSTKTK